MTGASLPIPLSVITGFLGSGKTTLLNRLLAHPEMGETAVLINEFGEIGLDHLLVRELSEDVVLLNSGCLCCSMRGDLVDSLRDLFLKRVHGTVPEFKRAVIETTGLADPAPIIHTLMTDPLIGARYRLDGIVTTVDAVFGAGQLSDHVEPVKQAAVADRLVLTKTDIAEAATVGDLRHRLRALNPGAPMIVSADGAVAPNDLFGCGLFDAAGKNPDVERWLNAEAYEDDRHHHAHDVNRHDAHISAFCLTIDKPVAWQGLVMWLEMLLATHGESLLRVKGILNVEDQDTPVAIHGVQHVFHPPVTLPAWPDGERRSRIVFITRDMGRAAIEATFHAFADAFETPADPADPPGTLR
jgi:G3E family GTPase